MPALPFLTFNALPLFLGEAVPFCSLSVLSLGLKKVTLLKFKSWTQLTFSSLNQHIYWHETKKIIFAQKFSTKI